MNDLQERDWRRLVKTIQRDNCVLVLGPDACFETDDPERVPLTTMLARELAQALPEATGIVNELPLLSQLYLQRPEYDRIDLELDLTDFYAAYAGKTAALYRDLAALPFTLCLTTTPDDFLVNAFLEAGKDPNKAYYDFSDPGRSAAPIQAGTANPVVFSLLGHISNPPSLVLTETELLQYFVTVVRGGSGLPDYVAARLKDPQTAFIFVGFRFQRWSSRVLLHVLQAHAHPARSFALESEAFFSHPDRHRLALFFEQAHSIVFRRHDWPEFAAELRKRYQAIAGTAAPAPLPQVAGPKVFLCHDSRDRELVLTLENRLRQLGIDSWLDKQDLRGGDDWDRQIKHVLRKQVDFVLVCESPNMRTKGESYLHLEIKEALERQKWFPVGERFLIPGTLQPCDGLPELDHLHREDLVSEQGLQRLAASLRDDWLARSGQPQRDTG